MDQKTAKLLNAFCAEREDFYFAETTSSTLFSKTHRVFISNRRVIFLRSGGSFESIFLEVIDGIRLQSIHPVTRSAVILGSLLLMVLLALVLAGVYPLPVRFDFDQTETTEAFMLVAILILAVFAALFYWMTASKLLFDLSGKDKAIAVPWSGGAEKAYKLVARIVYYRSLQLWQDRNE